MESMHILSQQQSQPSELPPQNLACKFAWKHLFNGKNNRDTLKK